MFFFQNVRQDPSENITIHVLDLLLLDLAQAIFPAPFLPTNPDLIIAIPQPNRRMMSDSSDIVSHFPFDVC